MGSNHILVSPAPEPHESLVEYCYTSASHKPHPRPRRRTNIQAYLGDIVGSVPDHYNKVNIEIK